MEKHTLYYFIAGVGEARAYLKNIDYMQIIMMANDRITDKQIVGRDILKKLKKKKAKK
ncbi:MAG: hypothetical protein LBN19_02765 [Endomicrobium sp.]|nr:hypothetical protein [Endomicrobium sp.]